MSGLGSSDGPSPSRQQNTGLGQSRKDIGIQVGPGRVKNTRRGRRCLRCSLWTVGILVALTAVLPIWDHGLVLLERLMFPGDFVVSPHIMEDLGMEGVSLFKQHDRDDDGVLSIEEFEPIAHRLLQVNETYTYDLPIETTDRVLTVESNFEPLDLDSMSKEKDMPTGPLDPLRGLKYWKEPAHEWQNFAVSHLRHFLPKDRSMADTVGEVYDIIAPIKMANDGASLSSNRYLPPPLEGDAEIMIHRLLTMFHPQPFVYTRFGPRGTVAVVRAQNDRFVDIVFRIHAEFQLNQPPFSPFWFSPAQFTGQIIIAKDISSVLAFNMHVPSNRKLNVDMEWLTGPQSEENMEVDIGYMRQMSLRATRTSLPAEYGEEDIRDKHINTTDDYEKSLSQIQWKEEISLLKATRLLEQQMYPFKKVDYHNLTSAFELARQEVKPVHSITLWGALDDQSC